MQRSKLQRPPFADKPLRFIVINFSLIVLSRFVNIKIFGYAPIGYFWIFILLYSIFTILTNHKIKFPFLYYLPFAFYIIGYLIFDFSFHGLQSTLQYLVPLIAGMAFSGYIIDEFIICKIFRYNRYFIIFILIYAIFYPFLIGKSTRALGLPEIVMTCSLSGTLLLAEYFIFRTKYLLLIFFLLVLVPILATTRMGVFAIFIILPFNFFKVDIKFRIALLIASILGGLFVFQLQNFQQKMFFSGKGSIQDISFENEDFSTYGRKTLYALLEDGIKKNPVWGNGPRSELPLFVGADLTIKEAHNDYLATRFCYGWIGLILLFLGFFLQIINLLLRLRRESNPFLRTMIQAALTLFIPFFCFMYTDNILKYTFFFGTLHFAIIALTYALFIPNKSLIIKRE